MEKILAKDKLPEIRERVLFYSPVFACVTLGYRYLQYDYFDTFCNLVLGRDCDTADVVCWWPIPKYEGGDH